MKVVIHTPDSRGRRWLRREFARAAAAGTLLRNEMEDGQAGRACGAAAQRLSGTRSPRLGPVALCGSRQSWRDAAPAPSSLPGRAAVPRPGSGSFKSPWRSLEDSPRPALLARLEPILFQACALPGTNQKGKPWRREASLRDGRRCWPITAQTGRLMHWCSTQ